MNSRRITRITAENFMRLKAVDISPDGDVIYITGANGEGKSSVLNAICATLNWRDASNSIPKPIHEGEKKATVSIDLGDMTVTRTWTPSGTQLKVETIAGAKYSSPQAMLDQFFSRIGFDPLEFITRMQPKDQRQILMDLLGIDFSEFDRERAELLQQKSQASASVTGLQSQLKDIPPVPGEVPDQEISAGDIIQQIQKAQGAINLHQQHLSDLGIAKTHLLEIEDEIEDLEDQLQSLKEKKEHKQQRISILEGWISSGTVPDIAPLQEQLRNIEETNRLVRQKQQAISISERLQQAENKVSEITEAIKDIDQDKKDALQSAKFPITGLSFDESGVLFQGVPLKQASSAEQIRVSLAIGIAMNPSLKFLIIRDGSLLDSRSKGLIADMAAEHGMQVFIEAVDESGKIGFTISDGMVQAPVEVQSKEPGQQVLA